MQALETIIFWAPIFYLILINFIAFIGMWWDKRKARLGDWRVEEATLILFALTGGAIGLMAGIFKFRHKTKKQGFLAAAIFGLLVSSIIYWIILSFYI